MPLFRRTPKPAAPYERELSEFAAEVDRLSGGDAMFLRAQWNELDPAERDRARPDARAAIERSGRADVANDIEHSLVRWAMGSGLPFGTVIEVPNVVVDRESRPQAIDVLRDVAYAVIARDLISADSFVVLIAPWRALNEEDETTDDDSDDETEGGEDEPDRGSAS